MAYSVTGTAGNDTLNQTGDTGPGTVVGLAGDDCIFTGSGLATVTGDSGSDIIHLQTGNTGTVNGGTEDDQIFDNGTSVGPMLLFGGDGADLIVTVSSIANQTIVGGNDSGDGADSIISSSGDDLLFGNGGDDNATDFGGSGTLVGGFGSDNLLVTGTGSALIFGNQGNDVLTDMATGNQTVLGGLGNDAVVVNAGPALIFGNEGADTVAATGAGSTLVGGNDSADGDDSLSAGGGTSMVFGNGGADTIRAFISINTVIGGAGNDSIVAGRLIFANEGNDSIFAVGATNTVFGGTGNDWMSGDIAADTLQGNEDNDTILGGHGIDTISGGAGNDVFAYASAAEDGDNAAGGGPVELITDVDFAVDRFDNEFNVTFAANMGGGTGANLSTSVNNAIAAAFALAGGGAATVVAAQFTFAGRTYLAIEQTAGNAVFDDPTDLLLDITGVTGTIGASNFI
jgi:Ca2+-binding RTX toxin-like protein